MQRRKRKIMAEAESLPRCGFFLGRIEKLFIVQHYYLYIHTLAVSAHNVTLHSVVE